MRVRSAVRIILAGGLLTGAFVACVPPAPQPRERQAQRPADGHGAQGRPAEEVRFRSGDHVLAGVLYRPEGAGPHPAVALVLGSGSADRTYGGVATALGRHFARAGFACLAWDKPGVGQSTGDYNEQTFQDRAAEALAAIDYLRARPDIVRDRVGLWGHSQGGIVVPLAAALSGKVAFLIEVAGWQGPAWRQDMVRVEAELRADGFPKEDVAKAVAFARKRMDFIRGTGPFEELDREQDAVRGFAWFRAIHRCDRALFCSARRMVSYDSGPSWEKVRCPVLVIFGDKDTSSGPPDVLVAVIRKGLVKSGNRDVTVRIFPGADHSLCRTETGGPKETVQRRRTATKADGPDFVPGYLDTMTAWLAKRFGYGTQRWSPRHSRGPGAVLGQ
ncbi:MAG TPA: alpha/beta fold hydrolase [Gemmataceae bacterium]|nr:alpha/beta fold hydrolase [Gemmataceae bacterium]